MLCVIWVLVFPRFQKTLCDLLGFREFDDCSLNLHLADSIIKKPMGIINDIFIKYMINIGANNYQRGPTRWAQPTWACQGAQSRLGGLCSPGPTFGAHLLVYSPFWPRKNKERTFGMEHCRLKAELGQEHFCPPAERFRRGNFPPGGGNHHHQQLSHLGEGNLHQHPQHPQQHHLISNPSSSLVLNLVTGTIDSCLWVTSSVDYIL